VIGFTANSTSPMKHLKTQIVITTAHTSLNVAHSTHVIGTSVAPTYFTGAEPLDLTVLGVRETFYG
jgi:hypothetical protein